jgi:small multidrug resistance pump
MSWLFLSIAIVFEVTGTSLLKHSEGMSKLLPTVLSLGSYGVSLFMLSYAIKQISVSTAYAIWSAVGLFMIALIDYGLFHSPMPTPKIICLVILAMSVAGLYYYE